MARIAMACIALLVLATVALSCSTVKDKVDDTAGTGEISEVVATDVADANGVRETVGPSDVALETDGPADALVEDAADSADVCEPDCEGKECGDDGCGGSCGECGGSSQTVCSLNNECVCLPVDCEKHALDCGSDGCGGNCGECSNGEICSSNRCKEYPIVEWTRWWTNHCEVAATALTLAEDGTIIIGGVHRGPELDLGGGPLESAGPECTFDFKGQGFVAGFTPAGEYLWSRSIHSSKSAVVRDMVAGPDGATYVVGDFQGPELFAEPSDFLYAHDHIFVVKLGVEGDLEWQLTFGSEVHSDTGAAIALDSNGAVFVAGRTTQPGFELQGTTFQVAESTVMINSRAFLLKLDFDGVLSWVVPVGSPNATNILALTADEEGAAYVGGSDFELNTENLRIPLGTTKSEEGFVSKYTPQGELDWTFGHGGQGYDDVIRLTTTSDGRILLSGSFTDSELVVGDLLLQNSGACSYDQGSLDSLVAALSQSGELLELYHFDGDCETRARGLTSMPGATYAGGTFSGGFLSFQGQALAPDGQDPVWGGTSGFAARWSDDGEVTWSSLLRSAVCQGADGSTRVRAMVTDGKEGVYAFGDYDRYGLQVGGEQAIPAGSKGLYLTRLLDCQSDSCPNCVPSCAGRTCGDDGCGGECGSCQDGEFCRDWTCMPDGCVDKLCGTVHTAGDCGGCDLGRQCVDAQCVAPAHIWSRAFGGGEPCHADDVAAWEDGSVYVVGDFRADELDFAANLLSNASPGQSDAYVVRLDATGQPQWAVGLSGIGDEYLDAVSLLPGGGVVVVGEFDSEEALFGEDELTNHISDAYTPASDAVVARLSSEGEVLWSRVYGGFGEETLDDVAGDNAGNILLVGEFSGAQSWFGGDPLYPACTPADSDLVVAKLSGQGSQIWSRVFGGCQSDHGDAVAVAPDGAVYVAGDFSGSDSQFGDLTVSSTGKADAFVARLDSDGNIEWVRTLGGDRQDYANALAVDSAGNVWAAGDFLSRKIKVGETWYQAPGRQRFGSYNYDSYIVRITPSGDIDNVRLFGGIGDDFAAQIETDAVGNVVVAGDLDSWAIDFGGGQLTAVPDGMSCQPNNDMFVAKYDPLGEHLWSARYGGTTFEWLKSVSVDSVGHVYLAGEAYCPAIDFGNAVLAVCDETDMDCGKKLYVVKLAQP
jgi:hypothetical protein